MGLSARAIFSTRDFHSKISRIELFSCMKRYIYTLDKNFDFALHRYKGAVFGKQLKNVPQTATPFAEIAITLPSKEGIPA